MTIKEHRSQKKVAFGNGFIEWIILFAVDAAGLVQAVVMGADYNRCLHDINDAIIELENPCVFSF